MAIRVCRKTRNNTLTPLFGEAFAFTVSDRDAELKLQLFDADPLDADDLMGQVMLESMHDCYLPACFCARIDD